MKQQPSSGWQWFPATRPRALGCAALGPPSARHMRYYTLACATRLYLRCWYTRPWVSQTRAKSTNVYSREWAFAQSHQVWCALRTCFRSRASCFCAASAKVEATRSRCAVKAWRDTENWFQVGCVGCDFDVTLFNGSVANKVVHSISEYFQAKRTPFQLAISLLDCAEGRFGENTKYTDPADNDFHEWNVRLAICRPQVEWSTTAGWRRQQGHKLDEDEGWH